jgi:hypothetical protein
MPRREYAMDLDETFMTEFERIATDLRVPREAGPRAKLRATYAARASVRQRQSRPPKAHGRCSPAARPRFLSNRQQLARRIEIRQPKGFGRVRLQRAADVSKASLIPLVTSAVEP